MTMKGLYIDLRSDTVTLPSLEMRKVIAEADIGDELYNGDPSTLALEEYCANFFEKESALFFPSGMMANLVAMRSHALAGEVVLTSEKFHIFYYSRSAVTDLTGVVLTTIDSSCGMLTPESFSNYFFRSGGHFTEPTATLLWLENTISGAGGKIFSLTDLDALYTLAKAKKLSIHLDGARLFNASAATGISPVKYSSYADSLMITFTKGLGAPFGAILVGDKEFIDRARKYKKSFGGGMHQSGMMAAGCHYALKNHLSNISQDNLHAALFVRLLSDAVGKEICCEVPETNIVMLNTKQFNVKAKDLVLAAKREGVLLYYWDWMTARAVFHSGISSIDVRKAATILLNILHRRN